jgi:hypothetical protein
MTLDLTDDEAAALARPLSRTQSTKTDPRSPHGSIR